jgi:F0F1-type ATP synthase alpha subunit
VSDLTLDPKDISKSLKDSLKGWEKELKDDVVGHVATIADGVARVKGLELTRLLETTATAPIRSGAITS